MKIVISANGYPEISEEVEIAEEELQARVTSGDLWRCETGCNETGMNDDPIVYHKKDDFRS